MNELDKNIKQLLGFLEGTNTTNIIGVIPEWKRIMIVEDSAIDWERNPPVIHQIPIPAHEYEQRFDQLLNSGIAWVNIQAAGIFNDDLIITVCIPRAAHGTPRKRVSVNLSGPMRMYYERPGWKLDWQIESNA